MQYFRAYRGYKISITYDPANKIWKYRAVKPVTTEYVWEGTGKTPDAAQKAAQRKIDEHG